LISGGAVCTLRLRAHPAHTGGTDAWNFMTPALRCSSLLMETCPQVSKIKRLNRRETWAIIVAMGMNTLIKLKCKKRKKTGKQRKTGYQHDNLLLPSSVLGRLQMYLLKRQSSHLHEIHKRMCRFQNSLIGKWLQLRHSI
jgi:hypothetical protein